MKKRVNNESMKKMLFFIVVSLFLFGFMLFYTTNLAELPFEGEYYLYVVNDDGKFEIKTTTNDAKELLSVNTIVLGEGFELKDVTLEEIMNHLDATLVTECQLGELIIKNCYSPRLTDYVIEGGEKVNLQIAITAEGVKIGYPLILDSF